MNSRLPDGTFECYASQLAGENGAAAGDIGSQHEFRRGGVGHLSSGVVDVR